MSVLPKNGIASLLRLNIDTCSALTRAKSVYSPLIKSCCRNCLTLLSLGKHYKPLKVSCTLARECQSQQSTERSVGKTVSAHLTDSWGQAPVHGNDYKWHSLATTVHGNDYKWHSLATTVHGNDYKWHSLATTVHAWPAECMHVLLQVDSNDAFFLSQKSVMLQFCWLIQKAEAC